MDRLRIVAAPAQDLTKEGGGLYSARSAPRAGSAVVRQGFIEGSNVTAIDAMVQMITVQRAYEAAQRAVTAHDEALGKAVNEVGRT